MNCFNRVDERQSDITLRENITEINIYFHVDIKKKVLKVGKKKKEPTNKQKKTKKTQVPLGAVTVLSFHLKFLAAYIQHPFKKWRHSGKRKKKKKSRSDIKQQGKNNSVSDTSPKPSTNRII